MALLAVSLLGTGAGPGIIAAITDFGFGYRKALLGCPARPDWPGIIRMASEVKVNARRKQIWRGKPDKARQKDIDTRWTPKIWRKLRICLDGPPLSQIAIPVCGPRCSGWKAVTSSADSDGRQLREVIH
ncbi:hypothetical protein RM533_06610 [Croceicoccus sp. F390]|uniref:Uncharacterized protein n=1 Tax=Croceicoccus esteveae TaxID=3075597 RepID=A0ABU2ZIK1_9SPHN|nr:hypothetical protein [Croceicoccus sp. F390]MDT0575853.1 hypothetical protein [Croceicoccus sp. F390]